MGVREWFWDRLTMENVKEFQTLISGMLAIIVHLQHLIEFGANDRLHAYLIDILQQVQVI
jgi:hypothetical protein